jgi:hypothetical protein
MVNDVFSSTFAYSTNSNYLIAGTITLDIQNFDIYSTSGIRLSLLISQTVRNKSILKHFIIGGYSVEFKIKRLITPNCFVNHVVSFKNLVSVT